MSRVLVYGTLRPGIHPVVEVPGKMYNTGWYPGVVLDANSEETFTAECVEVADDVLRGLDRYEGYDERDPEGSLFRRVQLEGVGPELDGAFIYVYNLDVDNLEPVPGGDWLTHTGKKSGSNSRLLSL